LFQSKKITAAVRHRVPFCHKKGAEQLLFRVLDDCELIHPVHEGVALLDNTLQLAADTGDQFIAGEQVGGIHRLLFRTQQVGLDPVFFEFDTVDKPALFEFLDNPRTFPAVNTELLPELALENTFGF
jgi:hypothetical protein